MALQVIVLISFICLAYGYQVQDRTQCLLFNKTCVNFCPRRMHAYHTRCDRNTISQRTCYSPLVYELGYTCGWSRCDCNGELVLDESTLNCIPLEDCSEGGVKSRKQGSRRKRPHGVVKRVKVEEIDDDVDKLL